MSGACAKNHFGRITAQPMRNNASRPCTERSNERGTSGTMSGKRALSAAGGVPALSAAVQVTTAPFWRNAASDIQGARSREPGILTWIKWSRFAEKRSTASSPVPTRDGRCHEGTRGSVTGAGLLASSDSSRVAAIVVAARFGSGIAHPYR